MGENAAPALAPGRAEKRDRALAQRARRRCHVGHREGEGGEAADEAARLWAARLWAARLWAARLRAARLWAARLRIAGLDALDDELCLAGGEHHHRFVGEELGEAERLAVKSPRPRKVRGEHPHRLDRADDHPVAFARAQPTSTSSQKPKRSATCFIAGNGAS